MLRNFYDDDAIDAALRVVILRAVNVLASAVKAYQKSGLSTFKISEYSAESVLFEIVTATREVFTPLQFSRLFLGLGRQLEPFHFNVLFPLPTTPPVLSLDETMNRDNGFHSTPGTALPLDVQQDATLQPLSSVEDLFLASGKAGAIVTTSSALPLFPVKKLSRIKCTELLKHCLLTIDESTPFADSYELDNAVDERMLVSQLYQFGLKLEDAEDPIAEISINESADDSAHSDSNSETTEGSKSKEDDSSESMEADGNESSSEYIETNASVSKNADFPTMGFSRLVTMVSPSLWNNLPKEELDEKAISEAASLFITSVFDESENGIQKATHEWNDDNDSHSEQLALNGSFVEVASTTSPSVPDTPEVFIEPACSSVAGTVGKHLLDVIFRSDYNIAWKKANTMARLILGEYRIAHSLSSLESRNANRIAHIFPDKEWNSGLLAIFDDFNDTGRNKTQGLEMAFCSKDDNHFARVITGQILNCSHQAESDSASLIFDLTLSILMRYDLYPDVKILATSLIVVGIVSGHVSGRICELLGQDWSSSSIGRQYNLIHKATDHSA